MDQLSRYCPLNHLPCREDCELRTGEDCAVKETSRSLSNICLDISRTTHALEEINRTLLDIELNTRD